MIISYGAVSQRYVRDLFPYVKQQRSVHSPLINRFWHDFNTRAFDMLMDGRKINSGSSVQGDSFITTAGNNNSKIYTEIFRETIKCFILQTLYCYFCRLNQNTKKKKKIHNYDIL